MYYKCTSDLWSICIDNLKKFTKNGIYLSIRKDVYINDQGVVDEVAIEGWQKYFVPIDLADININEIYEVLELEVVTI